MNSDLREIQTVREQTRTIKNGYTLIELVIVLAVVTVLACILFAVFSRQRESARRAQCQGNMAQIFKAMQLYMQDNDSHFPSYRSWGSELMPYTKSKAVFRCPSVQNQNTVEPDADYGMYPERVSQFVKDSQGRITSKNTHEASLPSTSNWILMTDIGTGEEPTVKMLDYPADCSKKLQGNRGLGRNFALIHSGGANYLFADGHVKWLLPEAGIQTDCSAGPFLRN